MEDEKYSSDSDESDEEYCPDEKLTEQLSEEESGSNNDENGSENEVKNGESNKKRGQKRTKKQTTVKKKQKINESVDTDSSSDEMNRVVKRKFLTEAEEKQKADALWADFMGSDTPNATVSDNKTVNIDSSSSKTNSYEVDRTVEQPPKKVTITEMYDFAGEKVEVTKEVDSATLKSSKAIPGNVTSTSSVEKKLPFNSSRPPRAAGGGGGLGSLLGQIGKQKKISTLEKSKLDWVGFKRTEGIEEEIQTHNKGKDGYLERQDFLQRTDLKQFDIEKSLRQTKRSNR